MKFSQPCLRSALERTLKSDGSTHETNWNFCHFDRVRIESVRQHLEELLLIVDEGENVLAHLERFHEHLNNFRDDLVDPAGKVSAGRIADQNL